MLEIEARGAGRVWLDKLSLMPGDNVEGWRRDVVEAMKELAPPIVRWGGSTVDPGPYRWSDAVGDRADYRGEGLAEAVRQLAPDVLHDGVDSRGQD